MPFPVRFRNAALIYNPLSGRLRWKRQRDIQRAVHLLEAFRIACTLVPTVGPGSATQLAHAQLAAGRDLIIVCGGDGTVNEVVNGMAGSHIPLALLPAGTGNILAKELGLPWSIWRAAEHIPRGRVRRIALGKAADRYFLCVAGVGADANIVYHLSTASKLRLGILSYWIESFRQLALYDFPTFEVRVDGEKHEADLLILSRTKHYGGPIQLTRRADLFNDSFEACLFHPGVRLRYLLYLAALQLGFLERFEGVHFFRAQKVDVGADDKRIYVQVDGEAAGTLPTEFAIVPDALSLLIPERLGG